MNDVQDLDALTPLLDAMTAEDLAHLTAIKRERERGIPDPGPTLGSPAVPKPADPGAEKALRERLAQIGLENKTSQVAYDMITQRRLLTGEPSEYTIDDIAYGVTKNAMRLGLPRQVAVDAVTRGLELHLRGENVG